MTRRDMTRNVVATLASAVAMTIFAPGALADDPWTPSRAAVPYTGMLELDGAPVNVTLPVTFTLELEDTSEVWTETQEVTVFQGQFEVLLGGFSSDSLDDLQAVLTSGEDLYLTVTLWPEGTKHDPVLLTNRQRFLPVPYAASAPADFDVAGKLDVGGGLTVQGDGSLGGKLTVEDGVLVLDGASQNRIDFADKGSSAPSSSAGWKIRTWGATHGVGVEGDTQWYSAAKRHRFYTTDGSTWTRQVEIDDAGQILPRGAIRPTMGSDNSTGIIFFPTEPNDDGGDRAYIRHQFLGEAFGLKLHQLVIGIEDDSGDRMILRQGMHNRVTLTNDQMQLGRTTMVMTSCPTGYTLIEGICVKRYDTPMSYGAAQSTCTNDGGHMCSYAEAYHVWGPLPCSTVHLEGDFLADFIGDGDVLYFNQQCDKGNFDGTTTKHSKKNFVCCINPR